MKIRSALFLLLMLNSWVCLAADEQEVKFSLGVEADQKISQGLADCIKQKLSSSKEFKFKLVSNKVDYSLNLKAKAIESSGAKALVISTLVVSPFDQSMILNLLPELHRGPVQMVTSRLSLLHPYHFLQIAPDIETGCQEVVDRIESDLQIAKDLEEVRQRWK